MANITNYKRSNSVKEGVNSVKEGVFFAKSSSLDEKVILTGDCFFLKIILPEIKIVSFSQEFRCFGAINEFRTSGISQDVHLFNEPP